MERPAAVAAGNHRDNDDERRRRTSRAYDSDWHFLQRTEAAGEADGLAVRTAVNINSVHLMMPASPSPQTAVPCSWEFGTAVDGDWGDPTEESISPARSTASVQLSRLEHCW